MKVSLLGVQKSFNNRTVLKIEKLALESGKIVALIGPNGSGKTTLLRILSNNEVADRGQILFDDNKRIPKDDIAYLPQKPYIFNLTSYENVRLGLKKNNHQKEKAIKALEAVGMEDFLNEKANNLSGGEAQRVALARTLVIEKKLLLLDEPASSTDVVNVQKVEHYIKEINEKYGTTIVFSTHNPAQALRLADEVVLLWDGCVIEKGSPKKIFNAPCCKQTIEFLNSWRI